MHDTVHHAGNGRVIQTVGPLVLKSTDESTSRAWQASACCPCPNPTDSEDRIHKDLVMLQTTQYSSTAGSLTAAGSCLRTDCIRRRCSQCGTKFHTPDQILDFSHVYSSTRLPLVTPQTLHLSRPRPGTSTQHPHKTRHTSCCWVTSASSSLSRGTSTSRSSAAAGSDCPS